MDGDPIPTTRPDPAGGRDALLEVLQGYASQLPRRTYQDLLNGIASEVCEVIDQYDNKRDRILMSLYDLGKKTLDDEFTEFMQADDSRHIWQKVTDAAKNVQVTDALQTVINKWGDCGAKFLKLNSAPDWRVSAARLAHQCPVYEAAARYIVCVILDRLREACPERTLSLGPEVADLVRACDLAERIPSITPATEKELRELGAKLNALQLLDPLSTIELPTVSPRTIEASRIPAVIEGHYARHSEASLPIEDVEFFESIQDHCLPDEARGNDKSSSNEAQSSVFSRRTLSDQIPYIRKDIIQRLGYEKSGKNPQLTDGAYSLDNVFKWWRKSEVDGLSLFDLGALEIAVFLHHHPQDLVQDEKLPNFQFGLLQQLLACDPVFWLFNVCLHGKKELVWVPQPCQVVPSDRVTRPMSADNCLFDSDFLGLALVDFSYAVVSEVEEILYQPCLLPLTKREGVSFVSSLMTASQLQALKFERQPMGTELYDNTSIKSTKPWDISFLLNGISPLADAILQQRPYTDVAVQVEMDILLGDDRDRAWTLIIKWRATASQLIRRHFGLWLQTERAAYGDRTYELPAEFKQLVI